PFPGRVDLIRPLRAVAEEDGHRRAESRAVTHQDVPRLPARIRGVLDKPSPTAGRAQRLVKREELVSLDLLEAVRHRDRDRHGLPGQGPERDHRLTASRSWFSRTRADSTVPAGSPKSV